MLDVNGTLCIYTNCVVVYNAFNADCIGMGAWMADVVEVENMINMDIGDYVVGLRIERIFWWVLLMMFDPYSNPCSVKYIVALTILILHKQYPMVHTGFPMYNTYEQCD